MFTCLASSFRGPLHILASAGAALHVALVSGQEMMTGEAKRRSRQGEGR